MPIVLNGTVGIDTPTLTGLTTPLTASVGGTGAATLTANNVLLGNGTSAVQVVAPGTSGNVLTSNGTTWSSTALPAGGVTSLNGQTGSLTTNTFNSVQSYCFGTLGPSPYPAIVAGNSYAGSDILNYTSLASLGVSGTWRAMASVNAGAYGCLFVRIS